MTVESGGDRSCNSAHSSERGVLAGGWGEVQGAEGMRGREG